MMSKINSTLHDCGCSHSGRHSPPYHCQKDKIIIINNQVIIHKLIIKIKTNHKDQIKRKKSGERKKLAGDPAQAGGQRPPSPP